MIVVRTHHFDELGFFVGRSRAVLHSVTEVPHGFTLVVTGALYHPSVHVIVAADLEPPLTIGLVIVVVCICRVGDSGDAVLLTRRAIL